jgi:opacity protein-like surface antigen
MKKLLLLITSISLILFVNNNYAQLGRSTSKVGTAAAQFLKIGAGARAIGMGGTYAGISNDIYSAYYNPAGIANSPGNGQVAFNHAEWLADISYDFAAASLHIPEFGTIFFTLSSLSIPEDKVRTFEFPNGDGRVWQANSIAIGLGFAKSLTEDFAIGFQAKYIREAIWNTSANGIAIDIGTYYVTPFNDLVIGASISNFGSKLQLDGRDILFNADPNDDLNTGPNNILARYDTDQFDMPLTFRIGLSMNIINSRYVRITAAADATHPNDNTEYINSGIEIAYDEMFFVRAGYKSLFLRDSEQGLTLGGGINYRFSEQFAVFINYGWADYGRLEYIQFFDVGITF